MADATSSPPKSMIESVLLKLRMWSLLVLPIAGFVTGRIFRWIFNAWFLALGGPILSHLITMVFMIFVLNDLVVEGRVRDPKDTMIFIVLGYLSVLGVLAGLVIP